MSILKTFFHSRLAANGSFERGLMEKNALTWIWQQPNWPHFFWQDERIQPLLRTARLKQGILLGKTGAICDEFTLETALDNLLQNIITSSAIEGEQLNAQSIRSSLAKRMGLSLKQTYPTTERSEGLAHMMLDAISNLDTPLTIERLFLWHKWLFPNIETSIYSIQVGQLRGDEPMQVVSGRIDKPTLHFEAPPRNQLENELTLFIDWFNNSRNDAKLDPLLRSAICHFWFVTLHPFDDGNGRITRALTDLALAQYDKQSIRLYAMSATILAKRSQGADCLGFVVMLDPKYPAVCPKAHSQCLLKRPNFAWHAGNALHYALNYEQQQAISLVIVA